MVLFGIALFAAGLMGAWHVTKYTVPRALRAVGAKRRKSIDAWKAGHPSALPVARWAAVAARTFTALRWGPGFLWREAKGAWNEGFAAGKSKYAVLQPDGASGKCPKCQDELIVDGDICPICVAPLNPDDVADLSDAKPEEAPPGFTRPHLVPVPHNTTSNPSKENAMPTTMQTATGGEIVTAEQFLAESRAIETEAAAEMEDAAADAARAEKDFGRIEQMVASLTGQKALQSDIAAVSALKDPAARRAAAAKDRLAAAEQRLAQAKAVSAIAAKHVQLIGTAAGSFYGAA